MAVEKRFSINLDVKQPTSNRWIEVVEGDNGNILDVTLTDNGQAVDLTGCKVCAVFAKPDGHTAQQDTDGHGVTVDETNTNQITIALYNTSFSPGMVICELQVFSGANLTALVTSAQFNFECRRGIANADTIQSTDEWPLLVGMLDRVEEVEAAEALRVIAEQGRVSTENARVRDEQARAAAEALRAAGEGIRSMQETARVNNETARDSAEEAREDAETARVAAEALRQSGTAAAILAAGTATQRANAAAQAAEDVLPTVDIAASLTTAWMGTAAPYTQTVSGLTRVTANSKLDIGLAETATDAEYTAATAAQIRATGGGAGTVDFKAHGKKPTIALPILIRVVG